MKETVILTFVNRVDAHLLGISYSDKTGLRFARIDKGIPSITTIHGIRLSKSGIYREHPDLKDLPYPKARKEAIKRLLKKLHSFKTEEEVQEYIIKELEMQGYERQLVSAPFLNFKSGD